MSRFLKNPLDELSESEFNEFLIAKENDFTKLTENGQVIYDYYKWYDTFHNLQWHCYFNHKSICYSRNVRLARTLEIVDLLISEKKIKLAVDSETNKI